MDFSGFTDSIVSSAQSHPIIAIALALCFLFLMYRRPKFFLGVLVLGVILLGVYYMITSMASSGSQHKKNLLFQEEKQSQE
jgi:hypothetical protein